MAAFRIMAIKTNSRTSNVDTLQKTLTKFGCNIKMRLGLHEAGDVCSDEGLILLQLTDDREEAEKLEEALSSIPGVSAKMIEL